MVRFAVIGFGAWGRYHADAIAGSAGARLGAIASTAESDLAAARAAHPHAALTRDYREVLARDDIDAVSIVVPNARHEEIALAALAAGKHVLVEKPLALDTPACDRILAAARDAGRVVNVAHQLRLSSQWGRIRDWIDDGRLGSPRCANLSVWRRPFRSGAGDWRYDPARVGSWLLEELVHYVDLIAWYFEDLGAPATLLAAGNSRAPRGALQDSASVFLRWPDGAYAVVSQSLGGFEHHKVLEVVGASGAARATWSGTMDRADGPRTSLRLLDGLTGTERFDVGEPREVALGPGSGEVIELQALIDTVVEGIHRGEPCISGAAGRRAVALCEAARRSMETGQIVALADAA